MSESPPGIDLSQTFAAIYWGFVISLFLGGITIVQGYIYFFTGQKDRFLVRWTAVFMLIMDFASSALIAQSVYYYLIPSFGSLLPFNSVTPELSAECLVSTMITFSSQMYFVYQLYIVKRLDKGRWLVLGTISGCAFMAFAGGVACVVSMYVFHHGVLSNRNDMFAIFFGFAKGFGTLADVLATIAMCLYLTASRTGISETNTLLRRLVGFVIYRGALVTLIQSLLLITFYAAPRNLLWLAFHINVTKLYANTFFAMLNSRNHHNERRNTHSSVLTPSFTTASCSSQKIGLRHEHYDLETFDHDSQGDSNSAARAMPTVTKTVEIADI